MHDVNGILLRGLDGSNPLAYLAALGTLRTMAIALPDERVTMRWEGEGGAWHPRLACSLASDGDAMVEKLHEALSAASDRRSFAIGDNLNLPAAEFRSHLVDRVAALQSVSDSAARTDVDFLAAFGSEAVTDDDGTMLDTALRTMSGAGHQHFLKFFRELVAKTDADHLRRSLFLDWDYSDDGRGMNLRWDPLDDRRYALRWDDPSSDPNKTMRGANRLAMEALPLLPTMPAGGRLATTAFQGSGARGTYFVWPIWNVALTVSVVGSLLPRTNELVNHPENLARIGVCALYKAARITTGKFRNFTPSSPVVNSSSA